MPNNSMTDFENEVSQYTIDELNLILETQQELYSSEELKFIKAELNRKEKVEKQKIIDRLPKEITCPKCEMENPFENDYCMYCQYEFNKSKYYNDEYYETDCDDEDSYQSHTFQYIVSFLIPFVGFILGACLLAKDDNDDKSTGKACIIIAIVSLMVSAIICSLIYLS